jgi:1,4-alpha-glucan branching enzyme
MTEIVLSDATGWLARQRWFSAKDRPLSEVAVLDSAVLTDGDQVWLVLLDARYVDQGRSDRLLVVLTAAKTDDSDVVGTVDGQAVAEIATRPDAALTLLTATRNGGRFDTCLGGVVTARRVGPALSVRQTTRMMGVEQSNTSVVVDDRVVVKVIRKVEPGPNPDLEITGALTVDGFDGVPALLGAIIGGEQEALVSVSEFVSGARDGWAVAVQEARGAVDHGVADGMQALGAMTAALHATMRRVLPTAASTPQDAQRWHASLRADLQRTRSVLSLHAPDAATQLSETVEQVLADTPEDLGLLQRIHGDYHLGQVLLNPDGTWHILDFEGEPARPIAERRLAGNPAKDVAGMLRSLDYARAQAVRHGADPSTAAAWQSRAKKSFLTGYGERATPWLAAFEIEKLLYEIRYEAANRPDWLPIPLAALGIKEDSDISDESTAKPRGAPPRPDPGPDEFAADVKALIDGSLPDPHRLLGYHQQGDAWVVRAWRPGASKVAYLAQADAEPVVCEEQEPGLFAVQVTTQPQVGTYRLRVTYPEADNDDGGSYDLVDPYSFAPTMGEVDQHLLTEGRHEQAWNLMGANRRTLEGISGVAFAVWAPNAKAVRVVGDFTSWDGRLLPMRTLGSSGIWELFVPDVPNGAYYKFELVTAQGHLATRADPWAKWTEVPPGTASRVFESSFEPAHADWTDADPHTGPMSTYELHLASWRHSDGSPMGYRDLAVELAAYITRMGFTHVEMLPPAEHPFGGSWGYQVTGQFAPTSRFGDPDDFRFLVDHLHSHNIGVIVDWVPAHFPKDEWALRQFDGTALYEHSDPRLGEHPDWGTMVFNYGRTEVRNFIVASALFWLEELGVDGLRVDAVASMLYLDYSRKAGEWLPNEHGGRENLRAVELLQETNATIYKRNPHAFTVAEESTAWPGVSRPTHLGGLGFGFKWNMGWMHDTLAYFTKDPIYRRWHHDQLTFGLMYAFTENFVLPLSHDEVVHGKGSLMGKMPGDRWQKFANLRALYGWMWGHPGKQLLFMGQEFGQDREWSEERSLDWHLVEDLDGPDGNRHAALQRMVADLNATYRDSPALWRQDSDPQGFDWIDANNADDNLFSFVRHGDEGDDDVAVIANLSPQPYHGLRIGLPSAGQWDEVFNTDAEIYGGANIGNLGGVSATDQPWHGMPASAPVTCPPLAVVWLRRVAG